MIEASQLCKKFGPMVAVDQVSFCVEPGQIVGFLGENGAGKSTTMRLLTGYLTADSGIARIDGNNIVQERKRAQALIGYLPEAANGFPQLTVREFLAFTGEARGIWGRDLNTAINQIAEKIELGPSMHRKIMELSKGWRQRAWLAQALLHDPRVLILDEPTDGLDPNQKDIVRLLIREVSKNKAIILSSHILEEAEEICDRVIVIAEGRIVTDSPISELLDSRGRLSTAFKELTSPQVYANGRNL